MILFKPCLEGNLRKLILADQVLPKGVLHEGASHVRSPHVDLAAVSV
jgi:hypothetical protein